MSAPVTAPSDPVHDAVSLVARFAENLTDFLDEHTRLLLEIHPDLSLLADQARSAVLNGGKRLRPSFAYWGWRAHLPEGAPGEVDLVRVLPGHGVRV